MGGSGSGGWYYRATRRTTAEYQAVRIADVRRALALEPGGALTITGHTVQLAWTPCHYGRERPWFLCPECDRRAGVLYAAQRGPRCRRCLGLAYPSQNECERDRLLSKSQRIRMQLGGTGSTLEPFPSKPEGMRWRQYYRLFQEAIEAETRSLLILGAWLDRRRTTT